MADCIFKAGETVYFGLEVAIVVTEFPDFAADFSVAAGVLLVEQMREVFVEVVQECVQTRVGQLQLLEGRDGFPCVVAATLDEWLDFDFFLGLEFGQDGLVPIVSHLFTLVVVDGDVAAAFSHGVVELIG